ncbi:MAG TPA: type II secretion system F family protein [Candidatus Binatia bacterium]|jgi:type IV pilus assembly protein PilC|nr:type II secretion system F family protein [Candidatus Binatia bacterium]
MPRYDYSAKDAQNNTVQGLVEADSVDIATDTLKDRGLFVLSIEEHKDSTMSFELPFFNKIPVKELVIFSRQFSVLMGAKVPLVQALKTSARQTQHPRLRRMVIDVANEVETGTSLSVAMANHPQAFSSFFVNMIRSGETTGRLEDVMNYLADQMERDFDLMTKIKGAMIYPIFIIIGLVIVGFIMMVFVVPKLTATLNESGAKLPWTTTLLINTSSFFKAYAVQIVIAAVLAGVAFRWWTSQPGGKAIWDRYKLKIPVFGDLLKHIYIVRFTRSMSTLLAGGVDIPQALEICADIVGNEYYRQQILETKKEVSDGNSITTVFLRDRSVPSMIPQMMAVGEETGRLGEVLERLTGFYSRELSNSVSNLVSAIEPLIMLVMGGAVGIMVSAIILPMYNLASQM